MCFRKFFSWLKTKDSKKTINEPHPPISMGIEAFVQASIVGIMSGIRGAQKEYSKGNSAYDPLICPAWKPPTSDLGGSTRGYADQVYELEFDLAVTITETTSSKAEGKAGVKVVGLYAGDIGCSAESVGAHSTISRIRFKIPVRYPLAKLGKAEWDAKQE
jgi:hypothetical protein